MIALSELQSMDPFRTGERSDGGTQCRICMSPRTFSEIQVHAIYDFLYLHDVVLDTVTYHNALAGARLPVPERNVDYQVYLANLAISYTPRFLP